MCLIASNINMKHILLILCITLLALNLSGTHTIKSHFEYTYLKTQPNGDMQYRIALHYGRSCEPGSILLKDSVYFGIYSRNTGKLYKSLNVPVKSREKEPNCYGQCVEKSIYEQIVDLKPDDYGYYVTNQMCCRIASSPLRTNQDGQPDLGTTTICTIPGKLSNNNAGFSIDHIIGNPSRTDTIPFFITDLDKDSIVIEIVQPKIGASISQNYPEPFINFVAPQGPQASNYTAGFSANFPLGTSSIFKLDQNKRNLIIQCPGTGEFFVAFEIREYRQGVLIAATTWETIVFVTNTISSTEKFHLNGWGDQIPSAIINWNICRKDVRFQTIEKSTDGINFNTIDSLGNTQGAYRDENVTWNTIYHYRVKAVQYNNNAIYSDTAIVQFWGMDIDETRVRNNMQVVISPMPVSGFCQVSSGETNISAYTIIDHAGRILYSQELPIETNAFNLDCSMFPAGIYFIQLRSSSGEQVYKKILKN